MGTRGVVCYVVAVLLTGVGVLWAGVEAPATVSPGGLDGFLQVGETCPTFSWGRVAGARAYELEVYQLTEAEDPNAVSRHGGMIVALRRLLPGSVQSWTPSLVEDLEPGRRYAWSVRAMGDEGPGEWSTPLLFQVADMPSAEEVRDAMDVLRRFNETQRAQGGDRPPAQEAGSALELQEARMPNRGPRARRDSSDVNGIAAIRGEQPDTSGPTYGVLGINHSTEGAGVVGVATGDGVLPYGVWGVADSPMGTGGVFEGADGVLGWSEATSGYHSGVLGFGNSPDAPAGFFRNRAGGDLLVADSLGGDGKAELTVENSGRVVSMGGLAVDADPLTPGEQFSVDSTGTVTIADGTQGAGRVLTSDASGTASWGDPAGVSAVPAGAVMFFHLHSCPTGWTRFTLGEGRYLVGVHPGGALANAVGTPLTDQEHRVVGQHDHTASIDPDPHDHGYQSTPGTVSAAAPSGPTVTVINASFAPATTETTALSVTVDDEGAVAGTNAPYLQLLVCKKD